MSRSAAEIVAEYGPFPGVDHVHGVTYDGQHVWFAAGDKLNAFDPSNGEIVRSIDVAARAGTAFNGQHLFQLADGRIQKIDPKTGAVLATIPAPGGGGGDCLRGQKGRSGSGRIEIERFIKSIPTRARFFARLSRTASSPESPGSTVSFGTALGKVTKAI